MSTDSLKYRFATAKDVTICNDFYNSNYNTLRSEKQWVWEFVTPNSSELPFSIALKGDKVVGTQALIPIKFIDESGIFMTAKSEETLVSSSMRGKNLFENMYKPLFKFAANHNYQSIWGFTPAEKAFRKVGFDIPCTTRQLLLALSPEALIIIFGSQSINRFKRFGFSLIGLLLVMWAHLRQAFHSNQLKDGEVLTNLENADLFDDQFSRRFVNTWGGCTILRNKDYMTWRIFENPYVRANIVAIVKDGLLLGYAAFSVDINRIGYLIDIVVAHPNGHGDSKRISHILLAESIRRLAQLGATCIRGWTFNNHKFDLLIQSVAKSLGFLVINKGNAVVFHTSYPANRKQSSHMNFKNWYVTRIFTEGVQG